VDGKALIVPYCDGCQRHASASTTRALAAGLASVVVGVSLALSVPLAWESAPLAAYVAMVVGLSALPVGVLALWQRPPAPGHSASGRAAWWTANGELACTSGRWASELATASGVDGRLDFRRERLLSPWVMAGPIVVLIGAPLVHRFHNPTLRIVNLTENRLFVLVDGRNVASVEPTSAESPAAGMEVRVPSGRRTLRAVGPDGLIVEEAVVELQSGSQHLYAPGSEGHCFWLERTFYGRAQAEVSERRPLVGPVRFWMLPRKLDSVFAPNPEPAVADRRSSGGELVALRQARCNEAPPDARAPGR
jgi:hypothetical protein